MSNESEDYTHLHIIREMTEINTNSLFYRANRSELVKLSLQILVLVEGVLCL